MKLITSVAFFGLLSFATGQHGHDEDHSSSGSSGGARTLGPSPTESVGCVSHGDHWDCQGPKMTAPAVLTTTVSGVVITTTTSATHSHTHSHHNDDDDDDHKTTDKPGTGSLKPSPTESFGCTAHGDHWHCEGRVGASATGTGTSRSSSTAGAASPTSGVGRAQAVGFGFGIVAAAAVGLAL